jgi:hypothetical protein
MNKIGWALGLLLAGVGPLRAQVSVEVTQEQQQFLAGEPIELAVRITNRSGRPLHLGGEGDWLTFSIGSKEGVVVPKVGDAPVAGEFVLDSSKVAIKRVDLSPYFTLTQPGRYEITATVYISDWKRELSSPSKPFDLIEGTKLWEQDVGVPNLGATNAAPEVRRYTLLQATYLRGQMRLYVRITDSSAVNRKVFPIGPMVSFSHPEPQIDKFSNLHLIYQDGAHSFLYTVCDLNGEVLTRQTYDYIDSRPRLRVNDSGQIVVLGGVRRVAANDVPAPKDDEKVEPSPPASAATTRTNAVSAAKAPKG